MITPEIRELQVFMALVKSGSFSAAAQQLGVTQPAVSAQILKLEQVVGLPLFYRSPEGTVITEQGRALVPLIEDIIQEYTNLMRRAAYWKRSQTKEVKIWSDGSKLAREAHSAVSGAMSENEAWDNIDSGKDWIAALASLEVDVVLAGSFLKEGDAPGIRTHVIRQQRGVTIAWNADYYDFDTASFGLPDAISSPCILPAPFLAVGFREFLSKWCKSVYDLPVKNVIECATEDDAVNACKLGLGIMIFPGDADERIKLDKAGLKTLHAFEFILPKAFTFGIRYRAEEQNPQILATVSKLAMRFKKQP